MVRVRVELVSDIGTCRGRTFSGVVVEADYEVLLKAVANKLQLKKKDLANIVLYSKRVTGAAALPRGDLSEALQNGDVVVISTGGRDIASESGPSAQPYLKKTAKKALESLHWVAAGRGYVAARGCPNLETLAALHHFGGATVLVTLLREDERNCAAMHLGSTCDGLGMKFCHAPLDGLNSLRLATPQDRAGFCTVRQIRDWLLIGEERVVVHCAAGLHRTGLYLYMLLRLLGETPEGAREKLREIRQETYNEFLRLDFQQQAERIMVQLSLMTGDAEANFGLHARAVEVQGPADDENYAEDAEDESEPDAP